MPRHRRVEDTTGNLVDGFITILKNPATEKTAPVPCAQSELGLEGFISSYQCPGEIVLQDGLARPLHVGKHRLAEMPTK
ncbi:hypothetical protein N7447_004996 [Penicillium robsamsonii]|uniref:uncharacterized protein n=1 Tax=Penicillium robsamsonii TaxID=1792511 RepID=UPI002546EABD|nr:uncharacterized protein N7447_004996 [Penicillium robsamsonii]KAJ5822656.1 hypothetical protein N7447_004996 [Penicillium robsamsonii]